MAQAILHVLGTVKHADDGTVRAETDPMTKDEYITWKASRGDDAAEWNRADCIAADALIKAETLHNAKQLFKKVLPRHKELQDYLSTMVRCHFGSSETDELCIKLKVYPDWL